MELLFHELGINGYTLLAQIVNFLILLFVLRKFLYNPLLKFMEKRKYIIEDGLENAKKAEIELKEIHKIKQNTINQAEKEADIIIERSKKSAMEKGNMILKDAVAKSENLLDESKKIAEEEKKEAMQKLRQELGNLAILAAEHILKKKIGKEENEKLTEEELSKILRTVKTQNV